MKSHLILRKRYFLFALFLMINPSQSNQDFIYEKYNEYFLQVSSSSNTDILSTFFTEKENLENKEAIITMRARGYSDDEIEESMWIILASGARFNEISNHAEKDYLSESKCLVVRGLYYNNKWVSAIHKYDYENGEYKIDKIFLDYDDGGDNLFIHANLELCDLLHSETAT